MNEIHVKYLKRAAGPDGVFQPGQTRLVDHKTAITLAEAGAVEYLVKTIDNACVKKQSKKIELVVEENGN